MSNSKKVVLVISTLLLMTGAFFLPKLFIDNDLVENPVDEVMEAAEEEEEMEDIVEEMRGLAEKPEEESEAVSLWEIRDEVLMDYGSNPMPVFQDEDLLVFAYESKAKGLVEAPSDKSKFMQTEDGENFVAVDNSDQVYDYRLAPLKLADGRYRRYVHNEKVGGIESYISDDGLNFEQEEGLRYEIDTGGERDPAFFGVSTYFLDSEGGVVLLYNATDENGNVLVNRAYAPPETEGMEFELTDEDILGGTLEGEGYADPNAVVRENGDVWLVVLHHPVDRPAPPLVKRGDIFAYVSRDDGESFELEGQIMSYSDFEEFEVWSLNDPKITEFKGQLTVVVAAMVADDSGEKEFKWILVSSEQ
jgi:hypothetical protein